jgi:catechol 2,3-dioxygenase-like lactoylglutathione lyase family enzyme
MLLGLHHVAISTPDADRLIGFYRDQLGFKVVFDQSWEPGAELADTVLGLKRTSGRQVLLRTGNAYLELFEFWSPSGRAGDPDRPVCDHGYTHLCLDVDDLDETHDRLAAAGVRFHSPPQDLFPGVRMCYSRDPDGNVVEIQELAPQHPFSVLNSQHRRRSRARMR